MRKLEVDQILANQTQKGPKGEVINETPKVQAARILEHLKKQLKGDANKKIGVIYAANNKQAEGLKASLDSAIGTLPEGVISSGTGQAPVFAELIMLINKDPACKGRIKILPVSTSLKGGENAPGNIVSNEIIKRDLKAIQSKLIEGYDVFGMPSGQKEGYFAIGGKASKHWFTTDHATFEYKGELYSQGDFVQIQLNALKQDPKINLDAIFNVAKLLTGDNIAKAKAASELLEKTENEPKPADSSTPLQQSSEKQPIQVVKPALQSAETASKGSSKSLIHSSVTQDQKDKINNELINNFSSMTPLKFQDTCDNMVKVMGFEKFRNVVDSIITDKFEKRANLLRYQFANTTTKDAFSALNDYLVKNTYNTLAEQALQGAKIQSQAILDAFEKAKSPKLLEKARQRINGLREEAIEKAKAETIQKIDEINEKNPPNKVKEIAKLQDNLHQQIEQIRTREYSDKCVAFF